MTLIKGIDISSVQGTVDFKAVAATGVQFCIIKCGNGNDGIDPDYATNLTSAKAAGLYVGCYHFVYPLPTTPSEPSRSPAAQAAAHFKASQGALPFCDLEWPEEPDWAKWGCTAASIVEWVTEYLQAYEKLSGQRPIVYTYPNFAETVKLPASFAQTYKLWIASYETTPTIPAPWSNYAIWQNSGGSWKLPNGVPCDTDLVPDLSLWNIGIKDPPETPPPTISPPPIAVITVPTVPAKPSTPSVSIWQTITNVLVRLFGGK